MRVLELEGMKFNRLLVVGRAENTPNGSARWNCLCDCGNTSVVVGSKLRSGKIKSCGCWNKERIGKMNLSHGHNKGRSQSATYDSWRAMKERCYNKKNKRYESYGGKGIIVCDRWKNSFENFLEDMGERPEGMTLDRIDVNGNYEPNNCRWVDATTQAYNIGLRKDNTSGRTGVARSANGKRWIAYIRFKNQQVYLGTFDSFDDAKSARESAEIKYYGVAKK